MGDDAFSEMSNLPALPDDPGQFILYQTEDGQTRVEARILREKVWLSLSQTAELFQRDRSVVLRHIENVFEEGELDRVATVAEYATVQSERPRRVERRIERHNPRAIARPERSEISTDFLGERRERRVSV